MKWNCFRLLILFACISSGSLFAQKWTAHANKKQIQVGELITFTLTLESASNKPLVFPLLPDSLGNGFELVSIGKTDSTFSQDHRQLIIRKSFMISAYDSGYFYIPSIPLITNGNDNLTDTLLTDSFPVLVQTLPVDTTKTFQDIRGIYDVPLSWLDYIWYILGALGLVLLGLGIWLIIRYRKRRKGEIIEKPIVYSLSAYEEAVRAFDAIEKKESWKRGHFKEWYTEITGVIRQYIYRVWQVHAFEMTSSEMLIEIRKNSNDLSVFQMLKPLLSESDMVKFAKFKPTAIECAQSLKTGRDVIELLENDRLSRVKLNEEENR